MSIESVIPFFSVKRKSPEETIRLLSSLTRSKLSLVSKSYNVTNDEQRYELIRRVLAKELTIKKVLSKFIVGCTNLWNQLYYSKDNNESI